MEIYSYWFIFELSSGYLYDVAVWVPSFDNDLALEKAREQAITQGAKLRDDLGFRSEVWDGHLVAFANDN